jgi:hypothetical protein
MPNSFKTLKDIEDQGFVGFIKISDLMRDSSIIPHEPGVYMVLNSEILEPTFLDQGTGGFYKGTDPNKPVSYLKQKWVNDTVVIYIGKAGGTGNKATLSKRLRMYLRFGQGKSVGHYGGRLIWQIENSGELLFCWKTIMSGEPKNVETELISEFFEYYKKRPFANLIN